MNDDVKQSPHAPKAARHTRRLSGGPLATDFLIFDVFTDEKWVSRHALVTIAP